MRKRLSSEDFLKRAEELWQAGPKVKYQNPNAWIAFLELWKEQRKEKEAKSSYKLKTREKNRKRIGKSKT